MLLSAGVTTEALGQITITGPFTASSDASFGGSSTTPVNVNGGTVTFTNSFTSARLFQVGVTGSPATAIFDTAGNDIRLSGILSVASSGTFTKTGAGTLFIQELGIGSPLFVLGGTLQLGTSTAAVNLGAVTVQTGATLSGTASQTLASLTGGGTLAFSGGLTIDNTQAAGNSGGGRALRTTDPATFDGVISGAASLTVASTVAQTLAGANSYTGGTSVTGWLNLTGSVAGDVSVSAASATPATSFASSLTRPGLLTGTGRIGGSLTNLGTVAPGDSRTGTVGTLTVGGGYTQASAAQLTIKTTPGAASRLAVEGTAALAGSLTVQADTGSYGATLLPVLTAAGGYTGQFANGPVLTSNGQSFLLIYQPREIDLVAANNSAARGTTSFSALARTASEQVGARAADRRFAPVFARQVITSSEQVGFVAALSSLTDAQLSSAFGQLSGESHAALGSVGSRSAQAFSGLVGGQLGATRGATASLGGPMVAQGGGRVQLASLDPSVAQVTGRRGGELDEGPWGAWVNGFGVVGGNDGRPRDGIRGTSFGVGGVGLGIDRRLDPSLLLGVTTGFARTMSGTVGLPGGSDTDAILAGVYGSFTPGRFYADLSFGVGYSTVDARRTLAFGGLTTQARGSTQGDQQFGTLEAGYRFDLPAELRLTPFAGLRGSRTGLDGFTETGAGSFNLTVDRQITDQLRSIVGFEIARRVELGDGVSILPHASLGWARELLDTARPVTVSYAALGTAPVTLQGAPASRDSALVGLGADARILSGTRVYGRYDGDIGGSSDSHTFTVGVRLTW